MTVHRDFLAAKMAHEARLCSLIHARDRLWHGAFWVNIGGAGLTLLQVWALPETAPHFAAFLLASGLIMGEYRKAHKAAMRELRRFIAELHNIETRLLEEEDE